MRHAIRKTLAIIIAFSGISLTSMAQEEGVTHCEFARELCIRLGITIPNTATPDDLFGLLIKEGLYPKEGWDCDKALTAGDFARVIVQVMEANAKTTLVENRDDDNAFMDYLKGEGFSLDSVSDTMGSVGRLGDPKNQGVDAEANTTDPSDARSIFGASSENASGTLFDVDAPLNSDGPVPGVPVSSTGDQPVAPAATSSGGGGTSPSAPVSSTTVASALKKVPTTTKTPTTGNVPG